MNRLDSSPEIRRLGTVGLSVMRTSSLIVPKRSETISAAGGYATCTPDRGSHFCTAHTTRRAFLCDLPRLTAQHCGVGLPLMQFLDRVVPHGVFIHFLGRIIHFCGIVAPFVRRFTEKIQVGSVRSFFATLVDFPAQNVLTEVSREH